MTETEHKALALMNEVREEEGLPPLNETYFDTVDRVALIRAIEQHEALEAENERLRGVLQGISEFGDGDTGYGNSCAKIARAALEARHD